MLRQTVANGRKANSLGLLAQNVMSHLPDEPDENEAWEFSISELQDQFQARKGNIYSILIALESILVVRFILF